MLSSNISNILIFLKEVDHPLKFGYISIFNLYYVLHNIMIYIWFVSLYLYTVNITIISYCRIVYLYHIFHCNLCEEEIKK